MVKIEVVLDDKTWLNYIDKTKIRSIAKKTLTTVMSLFEVDVKKNKNKTLELSIILTNNNIIRSYNKNYRNIDKPTNVLSFPIYEKEIIEELKNNNHLLIGDIVLSIDTIVEESKNQNKLFINHLTHLMVHSVLHLFGFDHIDTKEAENMETLEVSILKDFGIANPYE